MFLSICFLIYSVSLSAMDDGLQHSQRPTRLRRTSSANDVHALQVGSAASQIDMQKNTLTRSSSNAVVSRNFYGSTQTGQRPSLWERFKEHQKNKKKPEPVVFKAISDRDIDLLSNQLAIFHKSNTPFASIKDKSGKTLLYKFCTILAKDGSGEHKEIDNLIMGLLTTSYKKEFDKMIQLDGNECLKVLKTSPHSDKEYLSGHIIFFTRINSLSSPITYPKKIKDCSQTDSNS